MDNEIELSGAVLAAIGANRKIEAIKLLRQEQNVDLKEAKDLVEAAPKAVKEGVDKKTADELVTKLKATGAAVEIK